MRVESLEALLAAPRDARELELSFSHREPLVALPAELAEFAQLEALTLACGEQFSDLSAVGALVSLRSLRVRGAHRLADLSALGALQRLEVLELSSVYDAKRFDVLASLPALRELVLQRTQVDDDGLRLLARCERLEALDVSSCHGYDGEGFSAWEGHAALRELDVSSSGLAPEAVDALARLPLRKLGLEACDALDDSVVDALGRMQTLDDLRFDLENELSAEAVQQLFATVPPRALARYRLRVEGATLELTDTVEHVSWTREVEVVEDAPQRCPGCGAQTLVSRPSENDDELMFECPCGVSLSGDA